MAESAKTDWETIIQNGWYDEVANLYEKEFPVESRSMMSDWFAENYDSIMSFDPNELGHRDCILACVNTFLCKLKERIAQHPIQGHANFHYVQRMQKVLKRLRAQDRMHLFQVIQYTLAREKQKIEELSNPTPECSTAQAALSSKRVFARIQKEIEDALTSIQEKCANLDHTVPELSDRLTKWEASLHEFQQQQQSTSNAQAIPGNGFSTSAQKLEELKTENARLIEDMKQLYLQLGEIMMPLVQVLNCVLNEVEAWQDEQRLVALGKPADKKLEILISWCGIIGKCFDILEIQLPTLIALLKRKNFDNVCINYVQESIDEIGKRRQLLINTSLVITKEPKQIIRPNTNFSPVNLVVLPFCANMMISAVKVVFINKQTAESFFSDKSNTHEELPPKSGDLKFGKGGAKIVNNTIEYQNMTVSKVCKSTKRGEQWAVEEMFWLYFRVTVNWHGRSSYLYTTSLPISVTTHPSQEGKAWTYVLWYNAFPLKSRGRFEVPNTIAWDLLIEAINVRFLNLGKGLSSEQKSYLKNTLFRGHIPLNNMVSKDLFCCQIFVTGNVDPDSTEDGSTIKQYTIGEWICCALKILSWAPKNGKLAKYGIQQFWKDGKIIGFIAKDRVESLLRYTPTGTFIIRFPENAPDRIGLYFYKSTSGSEKLISQIYSVKDFNIRPLQDRIIESKLTTNLYPSIPKDKAFTKMKESDISIVNGYFTAGIQEYVPSEVFKQLFGNSLGEQGAPSPMSSHSVHSNYLSSYSNVHSPSTDSGESDHSNSTTGSFTANSPDRSMNANPLSDLPGNSQVSYGMDPRVALEDNDMDL